MNKKPLGKCPRCQQELKSYEPQVRAFRFYAEVTHHERCERCGWESCLTFRVDNYNLPEPEPVEKPSHLHLVVPGLEDDSTTEVKEPTTAPPVPPVRRQEKPKKKAISPWRWLAAASMIAAPLVLLVLVVLKFPYDRPPEDQVVASIEPVTVIESVIVPTPPDPPSRQAVLPVPPPEVSDRTSHRHRRVALPSEDDWPAPVSFDCSQFKTVTERLQCAGRPL